MKPAARPLSPAKAAAPRPRRQGERSLSAGDWVAGANDLLEGETIRGVRISTLCTRLGVTKGSFYWHFSSRQDLLAAILDDWRRRMTADVITRASQVTTSVEGILRSTLALIRKRRPGQESGIERSIRDWARTEARAQAVLVEVDETRLKFFENLFLQQGFPSSGGADSGLCRLCPDDGRFHPEGYSRRDGRYRTVSGSNGCTPVVAGSGAAGRAGSGRCWPWAGR